ncbi:TPA: hypothetical protein ACJTCA_003929, partial [Yersinia enterocolitica]
TLINQHKNDMFFMNKSFLIKLMHPAGIKTRASRGIPRHQCTLGLCSWWQNAHRLSKLIISL